MKGFSKGGAPRLMLLPLLLLVGFSVSCDSAVHIEFFTRMLYGIMPAGATYGRTGDQCSHNTTELDLDLLITVTSADESSGSRFRLARPGDLLGDCVLTPGEKEDEPGSFCYLGSEDLTFSDTKVEYLGANELAERTCSDSADCKDLGDQWTCNAYTSHCTRPFSLTPVPGKTNAPNPRFVPTGVDGKPRLISIVMDHSESLSGARATDPNRNRIAAAVNFVNNLEGGDRAGVISFNVPGVTVVNNVTLSNHNVSFTEDRGKIVEDINSLTSGAQAGSHLWDPIIAAVNELRDYDPDGRYNKLIVLFTDGPDADTISNANDARRSLMEEPVISLYVVHLDHLAVMGSSKTGRLTEVSDLTCATNGGYFYVTAPSQLDEAYRNLLPSFTAGSWRLRTQYELLSTADFPAGRYGISTNLSVTINGITKATFIGGGQTGGSTANKVNSTIYVDKR